MKNLRIKLIVVIMILLTTFNLSMLSYTAVLNYKNVYQGIDNVLSTNLIKEIMVNNRGEQLIDPDYQRKQEESPIVFDYKVYTVLLNKDNQVMNIISHVIDSNQTEHMMNVTEKILASTKEKHIGNLYFSQYAYKRTNYPNDNAEDDENAITGCIVIINTESIAQSLKDNLKNQILIFLVLELFSYIIARLLTQWLIRPVQESFNKQKEFIADASHELKTPLAVIMASADALESNPNELKWLSTIQSESNRMRELILDLLDLAKMENDNVELILEEVNLSKLVEKSILTYEALLFEKNIFLIDELEENIWIKCNESQIKQVIGILIDNGSKYGKSQIIVKLEKVKNKVILQVSNDGEPIDQKDLDRIFERFYKSDKSRHREDDHYGLGLAIAKSIVEKHGGEIRAYCKDDFTTFEVELKIAK